MELLFLFLVLIPLITAFFIPLIDLFRPELRKILVALTSFLGLLVSIIVACINYNKLIVKGLELKYHLGGWVSSLGITLVLDELALLFSLLISISLFLLIIYSIGFIGHHEGKYYVLLFLLLGAMQGAILTGDIFNLYVFIELITITSAALVAFNRDRVGAEAAFKYLIYGVLGGLFFLLGIFLIYFNLGTLNMDIIATSFGEINNKLKITILTLFLTSLFIKMGVFPFHFWLPRAHSACPGPVSALLSGVLLKVFIYIFIRLFWHVFGYELLITTGFNNLIIYIALFSSIIGHLLALREDDIKRMLAFSTIGHIGMIIGVLAINTLTGFMGGLLHVISHLLMKTALFTIVGYLLQVTGSHHIADFNGVAYYNHGLFVAFIISASGMIGLPPLPGFFSKYYILQAFIKNGNHIAGILVLLGSIISIFYYLRYIFRGYNLLDYEEGIKPNKVGLVLSVFYRERIVTDIAYIFTLLVLLTGIFNWIFWEPIKIIVKGITGG